MWHRVVCCKFKFKQIYQPIIHLWGRRQFKYDFPVFIHEPRHDHVCRTGGIPWRPMKMSRQLRSRWHYLGVGGRSPGIHQLRRLVGCRACLDSGEEIFFAPAGDRIPIPGLRSPRLKSKIFRFREDRLNWYSWQHCEGRPDWCSGCVGEGGRKTAPPPARPAHCVWEHCGPWVPTVDGLAVGEPLKACSLPFLYCSRQLPTQISGGSPTVAD